MVLNNETKETAKFLLGYHLCLLVYRAGMKQHSYVSLVGLALVVCGEVVRKLSMITAATNFNHYVQYRKQQDHQLVTHGIYSLCRHPSYVGWFLWSIGTQVSLSHVHIS